MLNICSKYEGLVEVMAARAKTKRDERTVYPIYVVYGKDRRRGIDALQELTEKLLADADPQLALSTFDGPNAQLQQVLSDLRTLPFLSPFRIVVVKDADPFITEYRKELELYLDDPSKTGILLMFAESFPSNTRLAKRTKQIGSAIACEPIKYRELPNYLIDYAAKRYRLNLTPEAASLLIELAGEDSSLLICEIDKLSAFLTPTPTTNTTDISPADVESLVGHNRRFNVFNVIDAITGADVPSALSRLDQMLAQDREAEYSAVGAFAWHFRRLYKARVMTEHRQSPGEIIKQLRIWSQTDQFIRQIRQLTLKEIASALVKLRDVDLASKSGAGSVKVGLEKFIVQFCRRRTRVA